MRPTGDTMTSPWDLYDQLIDEIPSDITVTHVTL